MIMEASAYRIDASNLRLNGRRLSWLAICGQIGAGIALVSIPLTLYLVEKPVVGRSFLAFFGDAYVFGQYAPYNMHGFVQLLAAIGFLEALRRLGKRLSGPAPLGEPTARSLMSLNWSCALITLVWCLKFEPGPASGDIGFALNPTFNWLAFYAGALLLVAIKILRGVAEEAVALRAENDQFI